MEQLGQNFAAYKTMGTFITRSVQTVDVFIHTVKDDFLNYFIKLIFLIDHCFLNTYGNSWFCSLFKGWKVILHPCCNFRVGLGLNTRPTIPKHSSSIIVVLPYGNSFPFSLSVSLYLPSFVSILLAGSSKHPLRRLGEDLWPSQAQWKDMTILRLLIG